MKLAVLFSGGKDSCYALWKAQKYHEIACLVTIKSENPDSYLYHTSNISITEHQARAIGIPIIIQETKGEKEEEIKELHKALEKAKKEYKIKGVVTGAIGSVYQATRIQTVCLDLGIWCFNPIWQKDQEEHLHDLLKKKFEVYISAVAAYPFTKEWLGKRMAKKEVQQLIEWKNKYGLNPAGEGGEYETIVTNAPFFKHKLSIAIKEKMFEGNAGRVKIEVNSHV